MFSYGENHKRKHEILRANSKHQLTLGMPFYQTIKINRSNKIL